MKNKLSMIKIRIAVAPFINQKEGKMSSVVSFNWRTKKRKTTIPKTCIINQKVKKKTPSVFTFKLTSKKI